MRGELSLHDSKKFIFPIDGNWLLSPGKPRPIIARTQVTLYEGLAPRKIWFYNRQTRRGGGKGVMKTTMPDFGKIYCTQRSGESQSQRDKIGQEIYATDAIASISKSPSRGMRATSTSDLKPRLVWQ